MNEGSQTLELFRQTALDRQLLSGNRRLPSGKQGVFDTINTLGYVQIDTISVVQRAHHHTIWSRNPGYHLSMLDELLTEDRLVFEYWGHAASYLPMADYRYYQPLMKAHVHSPSGWIKDWLSQNSPLLKIVHKRVTDEGPLSSKDFTLPADSGNRGWWNWKKTKMALEILFWQGELMITRRHNFHRVYDLTERVLPDWVDTRMPDTEELAQFLIFRAINAHGIASESDIRNHLPIASKKVISDGLNRLTGEGQVIRLTCPEIDRQPYYAFSGGTVSADIAGEKFAASNGGTNQVCHILSPFDNFVILRNRVKKLFGFDYTLECYVPEKKRQYGYFSLPVLYCNRLVARMDAKADRKRKVLVVRNMALESGFDADGDFRAAFRSKLESFMRFNECERIEFQNRH